MGRIINNIARMRKGQKEVWTDERIFVLVLVLVFLNQIFCSCFSFEFVNVVIVFFLFLRVLEMLFVFFV